MATQTPTNGAVFIPEVWAKDIQENRRNKLVALKVVDHQYESDVMSFGDTIHITSIAPFSADTITPGTPLTPLAQTETEQTVVINQYKGKAIALQDMLLKQSKYELRKPYTEEISVALAEAIDSYILGLWNDFASGNKPTAVSSLTFNTIIDAHAILDTANVPQSGRVLIVNAAGLADLRKVAEFTMYDKSGMAGLVKKDGDDENPGLVGTLYGAPVYWTNAVAVSSSQAKCLLIHKSAIAAVVQMKPEVETDRDILLKADLISGSTLFGAKVVRPNHGVVISRTVA